MKRVLCAFLLVSAFLVTGLPRLAHAACEVFEDVNNNEIFDAGDIPVSDLQWLNGNAFTTNHPFVFGAGCVRDLPSVKAPLYGVKVTAPKIVWLGSLTYFPAGGKGVLLIADPAQAPPDPQNPVADAGNIKIGNGFVSGVKIEAGGYNALSNVRAVSQKSVAVWGTGTCEINNAQLLGRSPFQDTRVGVLCGGDLTIRASLIKGSRVNIQSINGKIDAQSAAPVGGSTLADACDNSTLNLVGGGGPPGNDSGNLDPGDFPCQIDLAAIGQSPLFNDAAALAAYCLDKSVGGVNRFQAFNDPLIMIAHKELDLHGVPGSETELLGRYRVTLASEGKDLGPGIVNVINTANTNVNHGPIPQPGGAKVWLFAAPTSITFLPVDHEDFFGPSTGSTNIQSACYESPSPVQVGKDGANAIHLNGVPDGPPCKQNDGTGFVGVLNGLF